MQLTRMSQVLTKAPAGVHAGLLKIRFRHCIWASRGRPEARSRLRSSITSKLLESYSCVTSSQG